MSPTSSEKYAGLYRKPRANMYTVLLVVALLALLVATVMMYLDQAEYQFKANAPRVSLALPVISGQAMPAVQFV